MTDPYMNTAWCVDRLLKEHAKHPRLIVAADFDDTCFPYHGTNHAHDRILDILREAQSIGFYIVLFTASAPDRYDEMRAYLSDRGITVDAINENPIPLPFGHHGKIYYNILLDDRAGLAQAYDILNLTIQRIKSTVS